MTKLTNKKAIPFTKMEGIGNDYVYINDLKEEIEDLAELAIQVSERHFGIGSDGLIVLRPSNKADFQMWMFNLDGSEGRMCGNGIRCLAKFIYDNGLWDQESIEIETLSGVKTVQLIFNDQGEVTGARVNMGQAIIDTALIPITVEEDQWINQAITIAGQAYQVTGVSMGNPHLVIFQENIKDLDLQALGPRFEYDTRFPEQINTEFAHVHNQQEISMRVWERGSGETLACGTGACAVAVAGVLNGLTEETVKVNLLGGTLTITWDRSDTGHVYMEGPARTSFTGHYFPQVH